MNCKITNSRGFTLVEIIIVIVVIGILAVTAIPKFLELRSQAEQAAVSTMVSSLESAMSIYCSRQYVNGGSMAIHNVFNDLSNIPENYNGENDPVNATNTPPGTWSYRASGNWIMYNPRQPITGGWNNGGTRFIIYQIQTVTEGSDTVGLRLTTTPTYDYSWN
ncbi:MAG: hypothetical protein DRP47_04740 [Candidatus Zixiibacteriota bacterium]|nr:MAG: hypothetical protein DRP47_04740 [candidate division Zixibacteria bacterium]